MPKHYTVSDGKLMLYLWPAEEGGYTVTSPLDPGLITEAETLEEAFRMAYDAQKCLREARAKLAPRRRQDSILDFRPMRSEVRRRLVLLVDQSQRKQHKPRTHVRTRTQKVIEIRKLDRNRALMLRARVFHFQLGVEEHATVEFVPGVEDRPHDVG